MGLFSVGCKIENHADPSRSAVIPRILVDTGSEFTWVDENVLKRIGIEPRKKDLQIQMANGQIITRSVGYAIIRVDKFETTDEVVFAQKGDLLLLGCRALEGLNLRVDSRQKKLVAAGPVIAALAATMQLDGERTRPRVLWLAPSPTTRVRSPQSPLSDSITLPFRPARAPVGTREGACAPQSQLHTHGLATNAID